MFCGNKEACGPRIGECHSHTTSLRSSISLSEGHVAFILVNGKGVFDTSARVALKLVSLGRKNKEIRHTITKVVVACDYGIF